MRVWTAGVKIVGSLADSAAVNCLQQGCGRYLPLFMPRGAY